MVTRTYSELRHRVALFAAAMTKLGVRCEDRVVGYIPNCCEAVEAMLAAASIGAIWSSTSPDFGVAGVLARFRQIRPKLMFVADAVIYNGKVYNYMEKIKNVISDLSHVEKVVIVPCFEKKPDISEIPNSMSLSEFLALGILPNGVVPELKFRQLSFSHPLFILFTSGTTGAPKCIVHSAGGILLQCSKEYILHGNLTKSDVALCYTTTGWMMWNWLVTLLHVGSSIVLYDGSPVMHGKYHLWDLVDKIGITFLAMGAKWVRIMKESKIVPKATHNLKTLHTILTSGSTLSPNDFDYVYDSIKKDLLLASATGGTDPFAVFAGWNWKVPVYRGELQVRTLGMAVECFNEEGQPVYGQRGHLVCTKPFPSMPICLWNDKEGGKYKKSYFDKFPGVWTQGDFCLISERTGGVYMLGRSDGVLNPGGVRFGSAEIYNVVESFKTVEDSLCVSQSSSNGDERVILFLKLCLGETLCDNLIQRLKDAITVKLSVRHLPAKFLQVEEIPYTTNGKKVEVAVKQIISGMQPSHEKSSLANPAALDLYRNIESLKDW